MAADDGPPLDRLRTLVARREELEELEAHYVDEARRRGYSWSEIAEALGVSKQAAHKRHAARAPHRAEPPGWRRRLVMTGQRGRVWIWGEAGPAGRETPNSGRSSPASTQAPPPGGRNRPA